jgi:cytochrome c553
VWLQEDIFMKRIVLFVIAAFSFLAVGAVAYSYSPEPSHPTPASQDEVKMPDVVVLGKDAKLGKITFNHVKHNSGTYSIDGTGPIACIECHHAAQPTAELLKHPPLKTAWPTDRTTTLTAELFAKDPKGAAVAACRDCHARTGEKPKLIPAIPEIKHESSTAIISLNNQQAMHRNCAGCHTEVAKTKKLTKGPTTMQCLMCHKKV